MRWHLRTRNGKQREDLGYRGIGAGLLLVGLAASACGESVVGFIDDEVYWARVPSAEQFAVDATTDIPGGFAVLRDSMIDGVELRIDGDTVTFSVDGSDTVTRHIVERPEITDSEGSGPLKGRREVLVLGDDALVLGNLLIDEPVIWPGSFEGSPAITVKPRDPEERGPDVSCRADENCLLLSSGADPTGHYENANNPTLEESPVASIQVAGGFVEFTLDTGQQVRTSRSDESSTAACGLSETPLWDVPAEINLPMDDPVLVHTMCPTTPGAAVQFVIMERADLPVLAPLGAATDGEWCTPGLDCLWFVPT